MMGEVREMTTSPSSTYTTSPPQSRPQHRLPLSCRECQRKKVKCDRSYPCGQCSRAGHGCTPSTRKPRAKVDSRAVDMELRSRIAKLEKLVETFQGDENADKSVDAVSKGLLQTVLEPTDASLQPSSSGNAAETVAFTGLCAPDAHEATSSSSANRHAASTFLSTLTTEVQALREAFEEHDLDDDYDALSSEPTPPQAPSVGDPNNPSGGTHELLLCPPGALFVMPGVLHDPEPAYYIEFCSMYISYMEPMMKIFHIPTLEGLLFRGEPYLGQDAEMPCNKAVKAAICFAGLAAMREHETQSKFGRRRDELIVEYRRMVDVAIYQTDPMNTTDLAALQALVLYSAAVRMTEPNRRGWTLLGLITRIACALSVHHEAPHEPIYKRELRRRLWYNIVYLDCYATLDRGSEFAIDTSTFDRPFPINCNDADFSETSTWLPAREGELTDMSFALVGFEGATMLARMSSASLRSQNITGKPAWQVRLELATAFSRSIESHTLRFCDPNIPYQRLLIACGKAAAHTMVLRAVRPLEPQIATSTPASAPRVSTLWVLQLATVMLQHNRKLYNDKEATECWRRMPWVPWHTLAVALAALCSIRGTPLAEEAWTLVDAAMARHGDKVADSRTGMLWKPIEKLRRKAAAFRDEDARPRLTPRQMSPLQQQQQQQQIQQMQQQQQSLTQMDYTTPSVGRPSPPQQQYHTLPQQQLPPQHPHQQKQQQHQQQQPQRASSWTPPRTGSVGSMVRHSGMHFDPSNPAFPGMSTNSSPTPSSVTTGTGESTFMEFAPEMLAVPDEGSWLDWEAIMKDMDELNNGGEVQMVG